MSVIYNKRLTPIVKTGEIIKQFGIKIVKPINIKDYQTVKIISSPAFVDVNANEINKDIAYTNTVNDQKEAYNNIDFQPKYIGLQKFNYHGSNFKKTKNEYKPANVKGTLPANAFSVKGTLPANAFSVKSMNVSTSVATDSIKKYSKGSNAIPQVNTVETNTLDLIKYDTQLINNGANGANGANGVNQLINYNTYTSMLQTNNSFNVNQHNYLPYNGTQYRLNPDYNGYFENNGNHPLDNPRLPITDNIMLSSSSEGSVGSSSKKILIDFPSNEFVNVKNPTYKAPHQREGFRKKDIYTDNHTHKKLGGEDITVLKKDREIEGINYSDSSANEVVISKSLVKPKKGTTQSRMTKNMKKK